MGSPNIVHCVDCDMDHERDLVTLFTCVGTWIGSVGCRRCWIWRRLSNPIEVYVLGDYTEHLRHYWRFSRRHLSCWHGTQICEVKQEHWGQWSYPRQKSFKHSLPPEPAHSQVGNEVKAWRQQEDQRITQAQSTDKWVHLRPNEREWDCSPPGWRHRNWLYQLKSYFKSLCQRNAIL